VQGQALQNASHSQDNGTPLTLSNADLWCCVHSIALFSCNALERRCKVWNWATSPVECLGRLAVQTAYRNLGILVCIQRRVAGACSSRPIRFVADCGSDVISEATQNKLFWKEISRPHVTVHIRAFANILQSSDEIEDHYARPALAQERVLATWSGTGTQTGRLSESSSRLLRF